MDNITQEEKGLLAQKYLEFQLSGLISYRDYLKNLLATSSKTEFRKAYNTYLEKEIVKANEKISKLNAAE